MNKFITIEDLSKELGLTIWCLRRHIYSGRIGCVRPGGPRGRIYFLRNQIDEFIERFSIEAGEPE